VSLTPEHFVYLRSSHTPTRLLNSRSSSFIFSKRFAITEEMPKMVIIAMLLSITNSHTNQSLSLTVLTPPRLLRYRLRLGTRRILPLQSQARMQPLVETLVYQYPRCTFFLCKIFFRTYQVYQNIFLCLREPRAVYEGSQGIKPLYVFLSLFFFFYLLY